MYALSKSNKIKWLSLPEEHDYPAAESYLNLIYPTHKSKKIISKLKLAKVQSFKSKDIFRASGLSLLGVSNSHVKKDKKKMTEAEWIREYVEKIGEYPGEQANPSGKMAGTGSKSEKQGERNTKSVVAGENNMGGTTKNIARGGSNPDVFGKNIEEPNNEYSKGRGNLKDAGKFANVPGKDSGHTAYKNKEGSYEAGGKGQGNPSGKMAGTGKNSENQGEKNVKSPLKRIGK